MEITRPGPRAAPKPRVSKVVADAESLELRVADVAGGWLRGQRLDAGLFHARVAALECAMPLELPSTAPDPPAHFCSAAETRATACRPTTCWTTPRQFSSIEATEAGRAHSPCGGWLQCRVLPGIHSQSFSDRLIDARETRSCSDIAMMQSSRATATSRRLERMNLPIEESRTWERLRRPTPEKEAES